MHRNVRSSFVVAAALSLSLHAATAVYFGYYHARDTNTDQLQSAVKVIQISLSPTWPAVSTPEPAPPPVAENKAEPDPPPAAENKVEPDPPPRLTAAPEPVVRRQPLPEPSSKPRPASSKAPETVDPVEQQTAAANSTDAAIDKPGPARVAQENERESYLARLLAHIDRHKFYPRSARRRGMQGEIQVASTCARMAASLTCSSVAAARCCARRQNRHCSKPCRCHCLRRQCRCRNRSASGCFTALMDEK